MNERFRIVFLGTGAAIPSERRALPALALILEQEIVLFDCSEGTQMRLLQAGLAASRIRTIFISHLHGDHIFGLPGLLTSQQLLGREAPLDIWGPPGIYDFLQGISAVTGSNVDFSLTVHSIVPHLGTRLSFEHFDLTAYPLEHSKPCYGYRLIEKEQPGKFDEEMAERLGIPFGPERKALVSGQSVLLASGRKIMPHEVVGPARRGRSLAYCTDTRPCEGSRLLAQDADVLIHDSTFCHALQARARETTHATAVEAAQVAADADAGVLFLWHISGRHDEANEEIMLQEARALFPNTLLSRDLMVFDIPYGDNKS